MEPGSYHVSVQEDRTDITVRSGLATVTQSPDARLALVEGERAWLTADAMADTPAPTEQNLIRNGDFSESTLGTWEPYAAADDVEQGVARLIERDGRRAIHFIRQGEENVHTEVGLIQQINRDLNVYDSLTIQLDVRLIHQSLSGAGSLNSEFPLRVEIDYTDIYGKDLRWGHGFYFRDPIDPNLRVTGGRQDSALYLVYVSVSKSYGTASGYPACTHQQHSHLRQRLELSEHG